MAPRPAGGSGWWLLASLLAEVFVLPSLGTVRLGLLAMLPCLPTMHGGISQTGVGRVIVQQGGRVVRISAGPHGRCRFLGRAPRQLPGLLREFSGTRGLPGRRPLPPGIRSGRQLLALAEIGQTLPCLIGPFSRLIGPFPRRIRPLLRLIGALVGLRRPVVSPVTAGSLSRLGHNRSMP